MADSPILRVTFGSNSTSVIEDRVFQLLDRLSDEQCSIIRLFRDRNLPTDVQLDTGIAKYYGALALNTLASYVNLTYMLDQDQETANRRRYIHVQSPPTDKHLQKTILTPFAQVAHDGPAIGPGAKYNEPKYLPIEGPGFYPTWMEDRRLNTFRNEKTRIGTIF